MSEKIRRADVIRQDMATFQALWRKYGGPRLGLTESNYDFILRCFEEFAKRQQALDEKYDRLTETLHAATARHDRMYDVINDILNAQETRDLIESLRLQEKERRLRAKIEDLQEVEAQRKRPRPDFKAGYSAEHPPVDVGLVPDNGGSLRGVTAEGIRRGLKDAQERG